MPTILSVNNYFYRRGGAEVVFQEQNALLTSIGWQVIPFAMTHTKNDPSDFSSGFVDELEFGENYGFMKKLFLASKTIYSFEARKKIRKIIHTYKPQIAHLHNVYHHISPSILSELKQQHVPIVMTLHDLKIACPAYKMLTHDGVCERCKSGNLLPIIKNKCIKNSLALSSLIFLESSVHRMLGLYQQVDRFIVPSHFYLEKLVEWGWPREKLTYIPNCIDASQFQLSSTAGNSFVYFGRLSEEKGILTLLKAAAKASVRVDIIGEGELSAQARQLADTLGVDACFHGYQRGESLYTIIQSARAVVLPSEWYENAPISILEAYALGKPVIGANIGGIPEMIKEGVTGALFPSADSEALASILKDFSLLSQDKLTEMGYCARQWVDKSFSTQNYKESLLKLYTELGVDDAETK